MDYLSSVDYHHLQSIPEGVTINFRDPGPGHKKNQIKFCKALYDFTGKTSSELSFRAGDVIQVMRTKTPAGGDDGWWEGEVGGRAGLFPSLVVEPLLDTKLVATSLGPGHQEKLEIVEPELGAMSKPLSPVKLQFERKSKLRSPASSRKSDKEFPLCGPTDLKSEPEKGKTGYIPKLKPPPPYSVVVTPATPGAPAPQHNR